MIQKYVHTITDIVTIDLDFLLSHAKPFPYLVPNIYNNVQ